MRKFIISAVVAAVAAVSFAAPSQAGHYGYKSYSQKHHGYKVRIRGRTPCCFENFGEAPAISTSI